MTAQLDRRLHPVRPDLASVDYRDQVQSERFVEGTDLCVVADKVALRACPDLAKGIDTELNFGEIFRVFETTAEGWSWGQLQTDGYVGWLPSQALGPFEQPTHRVAALRTYRYPAAEMKSPVCSQVSIGALVRVIGYETTRGLEYAKLCDGSFIVAKHLVECNHKISDWVTIAQSFVGTPYLWGGRSSLGLDCSALIQLSLQAGGLNAPRDTDMQETMLAETLDLSTGLPDLRRGDLMFWKGHVGVMVDPTTLLHANGYSMTVAYEDLQEALKRIGDNEFGQLTSLKRLSSTSFTEV
ncbi:Dipeptidyl-peptidase 6 [Pseudovibrio axinellae]|uniref:Dipeptidyl-peptidase 6 n=1 Tax=Pseudovibrio axinellae TaxID=989403 RepID=A0A161VCN0_9HYPH|nr:NlpC/P60 family protein [Pseudovibrio axinellae]KZL21984.1 Dipeptidyl-peptidase 6 [Pseudovibrio axinellae]SEQ59791.1 NlpC/P60 family protein [Pseudovibrio axinellae]